MQIVSRIAHLQLLPSVTVLKGEGNHNKRKALRMQEFDNQTLKIKHLQTRENPLC